MSSNLPIRNAVRNAVKPEVNNVLLFLKLSLNCFYSFYFQLLGFMYSWLTFYHQGKLTFPFKFYALK